MKSITFIPTVLLAGLSAAMVFLFFNPLNWGVTRSRSFSVQAFGEIQAGDTISSVIQSLGDPLEVVEVSDGAAGPCRNFVFTSEPAAWWVFSYYKAWVFVDAKGNVIRTIKYEEP